jgi:hypothetical protein
MVAIFLICLITALLTGALWLYSDQVRIKSEARNSVLEVSQSSARDVQMFVEKIAGATSAVAGQPDMAMAIQAGNIDTIKPAADHLNASIPPAEFVQVIDQNGSILYSTVPSTINNLSIYGWYNTSEKDRTFITNPYYSTVTGKNVFATVSPVKDNNTSVGQLLTASGLNEMQNIVRSPGVLNANTLVVDRDGRLISRDNRTQLDIRSNVSAYSPARLIERE